VLLCRAVNYNLFKPSLIPANVSLPLNWHKSTLSKYGDKSAWGSSDCYRKTYSYVDLVVTKHYRLQPRSCILVLKPNLNLDKGNDSNGKKSFDLFTILVTCLHQMNVVMYTKMMPKFRV